MIEGFDWKNPDYTPIFQRRQAMLEGIRADKTGETLAYLKAFYALNIPQFICDWGCTADPRNVEIGLPAVIPFILYPRQVEWINWVIESWRSRRPGVTPKSRELGVSWLAISAASSLCLFNRDLTIGFGSRKLELVDNLGDPDCLFWKARTFIGLLPPEFTDGWDAKRDAPEKRIRFANGSVMKGEGGDDIGRGGRSGIYFVDEAAHLARPELAEASLSQTTNCRMDIGTANGPAGPFYRKVIEWPSERVFRFHWRDDPRKDDAWYAKQLDELDPVTVAQEVDIDFTASLEGILIPAIYVQAAIDAHVKLGFLPTGSRRATLDVADQGADGNALVITHGILLEHAEEWTGKGSDIFATVEKSFMLYDDHACNEYRYDSDGLGADVRGDARILNEKRPAQRKITALAFRGSGEVLEPEGEDVKGRKNKDFFGNAKAQEWWRLRRRFIATYRAVVEGKPYAPDDLISISSNIPAKVRNKLMAELSQPTYKLQLGKIYIDKKPEGARSPNLADGTMMSYARLGKTPMLFTRQMLEQMAQ